MVQEATVVINGIGFMYQPLTNHKLVENATLLVEQDSVKTEHQFHWMHDFRRNPNPTSKQLCLDKGEEKQDPKVQEQESSNCHR